MAKAKRARTLAEQIAALDDPKPLDYDPEEINEHEDSTNDELSDGGSEDPFAGREHYVDVGKSKLRKRDVVPLGPQYAGTRVSRNAVEDEDSDDPFSRGFDEGSSDGEEPGLRKPRRSASSEEEELSGDDDVDGIGVSVASSGEDANEDGDEVLHSEDADSDDGGVALPNSESDDIDRAKIRKMMSEESRTVAAALSAAAKADAEKGRAVKSQRKAFDTLLNTRIRLQKALIASNTIALAPSADDRDGADTDAAAMEAAFKSAETAALTLLNNLTRLRSALDAARAGTKRPAFVAFAASDPLPAIWTALQASEAGNLPHRHAILDKWSAKSRPAQVLAPSRRLAAATTINASSSQPHSQPQPLTAVLRSHLSDPARLVARTQQPRSCAPPGTAGPSPRLYDDADFYGLLLKELLEQRSAELGGAAGTAAVAVVPSLSGLDGVGRTKSRKVVDTRASKGRKLRYVVHEKLQNFMAPEDRGEWGERKVEELFGSLLGRRGGLGEEEEEDEVEGDEEMEGLEEGGLKLFGT